MNKRCFTAMRTVYRARGALCAAVFFCSLLSVQAAEAQSEGALFAEIVGRFTSGSYEYVLSAADTFLKKFPYSNRIPSVMLYKAESLYYRAQTKQAVELFTSLNDSFFEKKGSSLNSVPSAVPPAAVHTAEKTDKKAVSKSKERALSGRVPDTVPEEFAGKKARYWLGRIYSEQEKHVQALVYLYDLVKNPFGDKELDKDVLVCCARSLAAVGRTKDLNAVLNYYIQNYAQSDTPDEIIPFMSGLWMNLGVSSFKNGKFKEAKEYFRRADMQNVADGSSGNTQNGHSVQRELSGLYQALMLYKERENEKALVLLHERFPQDGENLFYYNALCAVLYGENERWEECERCARQAWEQRNKKPFEFADKAGFWYAVCLFKKGSYAEAADVLQTLENDKGFQTSALSGRLSDSEGKELVLAQSLYLSGKKEQALNIFTSRFPQSNESAKALLKSGKPVPAAKNKSAHAANDPYLEGLCAYAKEDWKTAADKLLSAARGVAVQDVKAAKSNNAAQADKKNAIQYGSETKSWALYYGANALYRSGKYAESYASAEQFLASDTLKRYTWDAYMLCALSALQQGKTSAASDKALAAVRSARTEKQKQESALFAAGLYMEQKNFSRAADVLKQSALQNTEDSIPARFLLASAYARSGNIEHAEREYERIMLLFPKTTQSRQAAVKRGEIRFEAGQYAKAEQYFQDFRFNYPAGIYSDTALFFEAQCREKQNDDFGALFLYRDLTLRFENSTYCFASLKALLSLYRKQGDYAQALETARRIQKRYPAEFAAADLQNAARELESLNAGADEKTAHSETAWQEAGKNKTPKGRKIGFQLAQEYASAESTRTKALKLLTEIAEELRISGSKEAFFHAQVLEKTGRIYRETNECAKAAPCFLKAAERFSAAPEKESAEQTVKMLYFAVEAFDCAKMSADALAVYKRMQKDHAGSVWTARAKSITDKR